MTASQPQPDTHLLLLTNHFPFGNGEAFLESEFPFLLQKFSSVIILTKNTNDPVRNGFENLKCYRISPRATVGENLNIAGLLLRRFTKVLSFVREEWTAVAGQPSAVKLKMLHDLFKALTRSRHIREIIEKEKLTGTIFLYSYWLDSTALATLFIDGRNIVRISRAHGGDVYAFRHPHNYLSFRKTLIKNLHHIFTISEDGKRFLANYSTTADSQISVSRLGSLPQQKRDVSLSAPYTLVSCSFLLPVKRIDLLIRALSMVRVPLRWIHIGDGPLRSQLGQQAKQTLADSSNVEFQFIGNLSNSALLRFYSTQDVHAFINTSEAEGIPVTMMEVQSFGIPVIGPAVGGVPEIVSAQTGILFDRDASPETIARAIEKVLTQPAEDYRQMRDNSYQNWLLRYNAERNFPTFADKILSLAKV